MSCVLPTKAEPIFKCTSQIEVGFIEEGMEVYVYIQRKGSNYVYQVESESDEDGLLLVDIEDINYMSPNYQYELWVTLRTSLSPTEKMPITLEADGDTYLSFIFGVLPVVGTESKMAVSCEC